MLCIGPLPGFYWWTEASWGNMNLSIKTFLMNFKIDKNCIVNFETFQNVLQTYY